MFATEGRAVLLTQDLPLDILESFIVDLGNLDIHE